MTLLESIKPFWPLLFTFVLPRAIGYFRALKTSIRTRPPPRPLPAKASRALNILFVAICIFFTLSCIKDPDGVRSNVFKLTKTRLHVPTDLLFTRYASAIRPNVLTAEDEELKSKLISMPMRQLYLRYGPNTITTCPFCHPDDPLTYALHHIPSYILFPHLLNLLITGLATSRSISGTTPSQFRTKATLTTIALLTIDIALTTSYDLQIDPQLPSPPSLYTRSIVLRPLILCLYNATLAFLIYASTTGRFIFFPFLASASSASLHGDPDELREQTSKLLSDTNIALQMTQMKLRGLNVTKNAVVRDPTLKDADGRYWDAVRRMEAEELGDEGVLDQSVFEDEDVQAAVARVFGSGNVDVAKMRRDAEGFVREVTRGLDQASSSATS